MHNYSKGKTTSGKLHAGVLGYSGYSGAELVTLLQKHPRVQPVLLSHRKADEGSSSHRPIAFSGTAAEMLEVPWNPAAVSDQGLDVVFTATPPEVSMEVIPEVLSRG